MSASRLPHAVHDWLSMLDQVGRSIGQVISEVDSRAPAKPKPAQDLEPVVAGTFNRLDQRLAQLTDQLEQANSEAAEVGAELLATEEALRGWVDEVSVIAGKLKLSDQSE